MAQINLDPFQDRKKFSELATFWIEKQIEGNRNENFNRIKGFLFEAHMQITGGYYGSFGASFRLFIHYNWPDLEKYVDFLRY